MNQMQKPLPIPDGDSRVYWEACKEGRLMIQRCQNCKKYVFYPRAVCPECMSDRLAWVESAGKGEIYAYTVVRNAPSSAFAPDVPYAIALVELAEGVRMLTNIVGCDLDELRCGLPVQVVFQEREDMKLPMFTPDRSSIGG